MWRLVAAQLALLALVAALSGTAGADPQASASRECTPPPDTFFTSLKATGVSCSKARKVITKGECVDPECRDTTYGDWRCHTKGGIAFRTTRCKNGSARIVATASGD